MAGLDQNAIESTSRRPRILDAIDSRLLRAAKRVASSPRPVDVEDGLSDEQVAALFDEQGRYDLALQYYLAGGLSSGRLAELLGLPWVDVRDRFARLGLPFFVGPETVEELADEVRSVEAWLRRS